MSRETLLKALQSQYQGQMDIALANIKVYQNNPAGIGEHPDIVGECNKLVKDIAEAREMRETVHSIVNASNQANQTLQQAPVMPKPKKK